MVARGALSPGRRPPGVGHAPVQSDAMSSDTPSDDAARAHDSRSAARPGPAPERATERATEPTPEPGPVPGTMAADEIVAVADAPVAVPLPDGTLVELGSGVEGPALGALRALPTPEHQVASFAVHAFSGDALTASRALVVHDLLTAVGDAPAADGAGGLLVAVPDARSLLVHVVRDADVLRAAHLMATIARLRQSEADAICADVLHQGPDGRVQRVTAHTDDEVQVHVEGAFADALAALGLVDRSRRARRAAARRRR